MKTKFTQRASSAGRVAADRRARMGRGTSVFLSAALVFACAALPAVADTSAATRPGGACWGPGTAPGLFDWSAAPGIACRDGNGAAQPALPELPSAAALAVRQAPQGSGTETQLTFSGTAYMGIAVAF